MKLGHGYLQTTLNDSEHLVPNTFNFGDPQKYNHLVTAGGRRDQVGRLHPRCCGDLYGVRHPVLHRKSFGADAVAVEELLLGVRA